MSDTHTIMVALDLSRYALPTAQYAGRLARDLDADLLFVSVINQRDIDAVQSVATTYDTFPFEQFVDDRKKERHGRLQEMASSCDLDPARVRTIVKIGIPFQKLLEVIDEEKPDLLIMATKGRSDMVDVVMGSCARSMYRRCPIPLLSIRGDKYFVV